MAMYRYTEEKYNVHSYILETLITLHVCDHHLSNLSTDNRPKAHRPVQIQLHNQNVTEKR